MWGELINQGLKKTVLSVAVYIDRCARSVSAYASRVGHTGKDEADCRANTRLRPAPGGWPSLDETGCNWCACDEHRVSGWGEPLLQQGWQTTAKQKL